MSELEVIKTGGVGLRGQPTRYVPGVGKPTLVNKLATVMKYVGAVPKTGWNDHHKYHFTTENDLTNAVRTALAEQGVMLISGVESLSVDLVQLGSENKKKDGYSSVILSSHMLIDGDSGEQIIFQSSGHAAKSDDKGIFSAITGSVKYAIQKTFLIPSEDSEPERDINGALVPEAPIAPAPARYATANEDPAVQARIAREEAQFAQEEAERKTAAAPRTTRSHASAAKAPPKPEPAPTPTSPQYPEWCDVIKSCGDQHKGKTMAWIALEDEKSLKNWQDNWQPKPTRPGGPIPPAQAEFRAALDASMKEPLEFQELYDVVNWQGAQ